MIACHHDGSVLWSATIPNGVFFAPSPAIADVTGNGKLETFVPSSDGFLYAFDSNGTALPGWPVMYSAITTTQSSPIIVDLDGDNGLDIVLGSEDRFIHGWHADGSVIDGFPLTTLDAMRGVPMAADVDGDGDVDLVAAGWDRTVYIWDFPGTYSPEMAPWPGFHANAHNDGAIGSLISTAISGVSFAFEFRDGALLLMWGIPTEAGYRFHVDRATYEAEIAGNFVRIVTDLALGDDGLLRYEDRRAEPGSRYVYRIESVDDANVSFVTAPVYVPVTRAALEQNYPNPFNPTTTIEYFVPEGRVGHVTLAIYDVRGALVRRLVDGEQEGGRHVVKWDGRNNRGAQTSSGIYFYRLVQPGFSATRKMVLLK